MSPTEDPGSNDRRALVLIGSAIAVVVVIAVVAFAVLGGDSDDTAVATSDGCPPEDASGPQVLQFAGPPPMCIDETATFEARMITSEGDIVIELDATLDPVSVNNFVFLARNNFYDGTTFHRVIQDFVIQGGDPVGDPPGTGSPGYEFQGSPGPAAGYELGAFAMANRGDASSNGAQFFIITGPNGQALPPLYSPMGIVTEGLEIATAIQSVPTQGADQPIDDIVVSDVVITELG